ncbi:MAG: alpha/beta fold hydrolase [Candidatus Dormibacteria bacterium]
MSWTDRTVTGSGIPIAVRDYPGERRPIVLLHGGGRTLCDWALVAPLLAPLHRVVAIDLRGHGQSAPVADWTFADAMADLDAVLAVLELPDAVLVGHSLGGMVAALYARANPGCAGIANVDGSGTALPTQIPGVPGGRERLQAMIVANAKTLRAEVVPPEKGDASWMEARIGVLHAGPEGIGGEAVRRRFTQLPDGEFQLNPSSACSASLYEAVNEIPTFEVLAELSCPLLYVKATRVEPAADPGMEQLMSAFNQGCKLELRRLERRNPRAKLITFDCGHLVPLERPTHLAAAILDFLTGMG